MQKETEDHEEEEMNPEGGNASEVYEHIKHAEKFDDYVFDAATEEQIKQQASNLEEGKFQNILNAVNICIVVITIPQFLFTIPIKRFQFSCYSKPCFQIPTM